MQPQEKVYSEGRVCPWDSTWSRVHEAPWGEGEILGCSLGVRGLREGPGSGLEEKDLCLHFLFQSRGRPCCGALTPDGGRGRAKQVIPHRLRAPPAPPGPHSRPSPGRQALVLLRNFPGGDSPRRPSLAPHTTSCLRSRHPRPPAALWDPGLSPPAAPHLPGAPGPPPPGGRPPRKERGPPVTPAHLSPVPDTLAIYLSLLFIVRRPDLPAKSELERPAAARDGRPGQARSSPPPTVPSAAPEPSRPRALAGRTLFMEPQGPSPPSSGLPVFTASLVFAS